MCSLGGTYKCLIGFILNFGIQLPIYRPASLPEKNGILKNFQCFLNWFQWEMVCDRRILIATSQSVVLAANPVGATVGGALTDKYISLISTSYLTRMFWIKFEEVMT